MQDRSWQIIPGTNPILLVAGHNFPHIREGKIKARDIGTGEIVKKLCEKYQCWGIVSTNVIIDPNWHHNSPFRNKVKEIIFNNKIYAVVDIHGRKIGYPHLIEFFPNKSFLEKWGVSEIITKEVNIGGQFTLIKDLETLGVPGIAVEIRKDGRVSTPDHEENLQKSREEMEKLMNKILT